MAVSGEWFCWNWSGGVEADPQTKVLATSGEVVLIQWGVKPC